MGVAEAESVTSRAVLLRTSIASAPPRTSTGARAFGTLYGEYNDLYDVYDGDDHEEDEEDDGYTGKGQIKCWNCGGVGHKSDVCPSAWTNDGEDEGQYGNVVLPGM